MTSSPRKRFSRGLSLDLTSIPSGGSHTSSHRGFSQPVPVAGVDGMGLGLDSGNTDHEAPGDMGRPASALDFSGRDSILREPVNHRVKLVCVGDGGCGKTCLLVTYARGVFPEMYVPTVFENYLSRVRMPNGRVVELALWDTAGQEEYDRLRALSYPEADLLLVCFAIDSPTSLDNVYDKWVPEITHHCPDVPFILVGLKTDLRSERSISAAQGGSVAQRCGASKYLECSARLGNGVADVFHTAISLVVKGTVRKVSQPRPPQHSQHPQQRRLPEPPGKTKRKHGCLIV